MDAPIGGGGVETAPASPQGDSKGETKCSIGPTLAGDGGPIFHARGVGWGMGALFAMP